MNEHETGEAIPEQTIKATGTRTFRPLRAWPAVLLALLMLASRFGPEVSGDAMAKYWMATVFGPLLCCLLLLIWWLAASRATWRERLFGFLGIVAGAVAAVALAHPTMRGPATTYLTIPTGFFVFALATAFLK
jgi:outer membrane protein assembly factor BamB